MKRTKAPAIEIRDLGYRYPEGSQNGHVAFQPFSARIPHASRVLVMGANGTGKSTLLRVLAGRHLVPEKSLEVYGRSPFFGLSTTHDATLIESDFPVHVDLRVSELLAHHRGDPRLEKELIELLGVHLDWRMCRISEGQRRRVQLLLSLRHHFRLLLLDEVTAQLDVQMRADLLRWLDARSRKHGLTILYATHILDGLWERAKRWPTHVLFMRFTSPPELRSVRELHLKSTLLSFCEKEIRKDLKATART